ncbi:MAG: MFS transporter [Actinomycetota bacterium]|nr:MFS transporter [Actinomycetota bacterium]
MIENTDAQPSAGFTPQTAAGARAFVVTPFGRLARTHAASCAADAMVATALADSLFFSLPAGDARAPVLKYLLFTMLPFAVVSPLIGPLIDRLRGGHRYVMITTAVIRSMLCFFMIQSIQTGSTIFFLEALGVLMMQKGYQIARSALVPTVVRSDAELVEANSKLTLLSGLMGFAGVIPAGILLKAFGPKWSLGLAMVTFLLTAVIAFRIPRTRVASAPADRTERVELRGSGIIMAGSAMGLLRGIVGFLTLLLAFDFRGEGVPKWQFGVVAGASVLSGLVGAAVAPRLRRVLQEENLLTASLALTVVAAVAAIVLGGVVGAAILASAVGLAGSIGKLSFDSILQRDAPDANRGRSFARFETRFQVTWVIGAFLPVAIKMPADAGYVIVLVIAGGAVFSYVVGRMAASHRTGTRVTPATTAAVEIEQRFAEVSGEVRGRLSKSAHAAMRRIRPEHYRVDRPPRRRRRRVD